MENGEWVPRSLFDTFTDIHIKSKSGSEFILDTKYKIINDTKNHYGISNQDAYQVLAYRQIHHSGVAAPSVALLYPKSNVHIRKEFQVNGSDATFIAATIDLSCDLRANLPSLVNDLSKIIQSGSLGNQT
ncbi:5-methylcytosine restriction system specificity protein McrC [Bdellovibrio bacteriovorus]|uniref:5-methylcytosine restriction system specificity protein McrC n=1 Tax=Bdellovibrio bacteriovorus TaxID=959 RepID=UPI0012FADD5B